MAAHGVGEIGAGGIEDRKVIEPGRPRRRGRAAGALPAVEADMMMIAARRDERRVAPVALGQREAEHADIEVQDPPEIGDFQMDMADTGAGGDGAFLPGDVGHGAALLCVAVKMAADACEIKPPPRMGSFPHRRQTLRRRAPCATGARMAGSPHA
jgi:hypothetical protein